jgi:uncharacterized membrane protein YfcA
MLVGSTLGGYGGAHIGRALPARVVRLTTLSFTSAMTAAFFYRAYMAGGN